MAVTPGTTRIAVQAALDAAADVIARASAGEYTSTREVEAAIMSARALIAAVRPHVSTIWGIAGHPLHSRLGELAARLLDVQTAVSGATETIEEVTDRTTSLIELAVKYYSDYARYPSLAALNPDIPHPGIIPPGTTVVRYVR